MHLLKYIWRNVTRNGLRSALTVLSIGFSLALLTVLHGYMAMQDAWGAEASKHNRVVVMNIQGFSGRLPLAYVDRIRSVEGIVAAVPFSWFGGNYKEEQMPFAQFGTDCKQAFNVFSEYQISPDELQAWQNDRKGCVVDRRLAEKRKWKIGDQIPITGTFYPINLQLTVRGLFSSPQYTDALWFQIEYLDEGMKVIREEASGNSGTIFAKTSGSDRLAQISADIDGRFESSPFPTKTQTEAAFAKMFTDMLGNIQVLILVIGLAVVFSLSLVTATTMAQSMRERVTEVAVLKAIGFSKSRVTTMVLGEACLLTLCGGILGLGAGGFVIEMLHNVSSQVFPFSFLDLIGPWMLVLVGIAIFIGLISGLIPAVRAASLSVVDGLRRVV